MRIVPALALLCALSPVFAGPETTRAALKPSDAIQTEADAQAHAVQALRADKGPGFPRYGRVLDLTRAHGKWGQIDRGEFVWLVSVMSAGSSDLNPVPEALVWVRAKDGAVVFLNGPGAKQ